MRETWPHAPPHEFTAGGTYMITAATLHRQRLFSTDAKLDLFCNTTLQLAKQYVLNLQAWAFFSNHYHLIAGFGKANASHVDFIRHLHRELAIQLNMVDNTPNRRVMYQFWDTQLTFEKSWLARLNYVHNNAVHHGLVQVADNYRWCSARWFETNSREGFVKTVYSFKTDRLNVPDDF